MKHLLAPVALLAARATFPDAEAGDDVKGCAQGLYMITVRGTGEEQGIGVFGSLIGREVAKQIKGSKVVALEYPATLADPLYPYSVGNGTKDLTELLQEHQTSCPDGKVAILGYSQGAQVTLDTLCGTDEVGFQATAPIPSDAVKNVVAITVFGDPTHIANVSYDRGTSKNNGLFPRKNSANCEKYASKMASWCDTGDVYCDLGDDRAVHGQYIEKYGREIIQFIVDKYKGKSGDNSTSVTTGVPTGAPTGGISPGVNSTATTAKPTNSGTPSGGGAATSPPAPVPQGAAAGLDMASKGLYVALPLALVAMFQMLKL
ncbi:Cutinase [Metarhizium album ARSEF 1941]|uniref:Cutinase n=1 Tax=Metarhizium album (strain ARSEF 1941) TaxID=1081103 RepID=A0A0B2WRF5_METAS|nr:Cutinase [Metarhizium album ARSEF 1941]KHN98641.1 Cutinase [Metarhizium album ARSEF 1941]